MPRFRFLVPGNIHIYPRTLDPVFGTGEHPNVPSFLFLVPGNIRMHPRSGFWYRGTAKTTLLETTLLRTPKKVRTQAGRFTRIDSQIRAHFLTCANHFRVPELNLFSREPHVGALKISNRRFEAIRTNLKIEVFCESIRVNHALRNTRPSKIQETRCGSRDPWVIKFHGRLGCRCVTL